MIKYRIICPLNDNLTAFRVKCTEDDKLYIKKILDRPQFEIYKIMEDGNEVLYSVMTDCGNGEYVVQDCFTLPKTINTYYMKNVYRVTR